MEQVREKELNNKLQNIKNKAIKIKIKGVITTEFEIQKAKGKYNRRSGKLSIYDKNTDIRVLVEMNMAYNIFESENKQEIHIKLDNDQDLIIKIIA